MTKLSKREKNLILILILVIILWLFNKIVFLPQRNKINILEVEKLEYEEELNKINHLLAKGNQEQDGSLELDEEKEKLLKEYLPTIEQAQILYILNDLIDTSNIKVINMEFFDIETEEVSEDNQLPLKYMDIIIEYEGKYDELMNFLSKIKKAPGKFLIRSIDINKDNNGLVKGQIGLRAYSIEGIFPENETRIDIKTKINEKRKNPFKP